MGTAIASTATGAGERPRRARRAWLVALLGVTAVVAAPATDATATAAGTAGASAAQVATEYRNPVVNGSTANPSIVWSEPDGRYYAYFNGMTFLGLNVPAYSSPDLVTWQQHLNVLPAAQAGPWVDASDGRLFTSPSVGHFPANPASSRWVLYFTGTDVASGHRCIGVATSASPTGPFAGEATPLVCPAGGAQDPSLLFAGTDWPQLVYCQDGAGPGIYNQSLAPDGRTRSTSRPNPALLFTAPAGWWQEGVARLVVG